MKGAVAIRGPVGSAAAIDTSSTSIGASAYVQIVAKTSSACSAVVVSNPGAQPLKIAVGSAGHEVDNGGVIPPGAINEMIPMEIPNGSRVTLKSLIGTQSSGIVCIGFLA
jgi:hypothetical protein